MFRLIVTKELRELVASAKFAVTFAVCSLLILLSFYLGARGYHGDRERHEAAVSEARRQLAGVSDWLEVEPEVFLPPSPLSNVVTGVVNDIGRNTSVLGRGEIRPEGTRYGEDPMLAMFRFIDLEFTFQVVLSLFAILFAHDAVCGERERGTLRLALSSAVPRGTYILAKIAGSFLGLTVPLLIPLAAGVLILLLMGVPLGTSEWARLGLIITASLLFVGAILGLSVLVSALTRRSQTSFVALLSLWVVAVLVVPRASVLLAARQVDVPSADSVMSAKARLRSQLWTEDRGTIGDFLNEGMAAAEASDNPQAAMQQRIGQFNELFERLSRERAEAVAALGARLAEERRNAEREQQRLAFGLARLSPATAYSLAVTNLAGTSLDLPERYLEALGEYQQRFAALQKEKTGSSGGGMRIVLRAGDDEEEEAPKAIDTRELPAFSFTPPSLGDATAGAVFDLTLLALFNLLFFSGAYVAFLRYDVR